MTFACMSSKSLFICNCSPSHFECHLFLEKQGQLSCRMSHILIWLTTSSFCHLICSFILLIFCNLEVRLEGESGAPCQPVTSCCSVSGSASSHAETKPAQACQPVPRCGVAVQPFTAWLWPPLLIVAQIHYFIRACKMSSF